MALSFDTTYYYRERPDVLTAWLNSDRALSPQEFALAHYNEFGWKEGYNPNEVFDTKEYLEANQDVAAAGVNPFTHFNTFGQSEGRSPNATMPGLDDFNWEVYLASNSDLGEAGIVTAEAAYDHFINFGYAEDRPGTPAALSFTLAEAIAAGEDLPVGYTISDATLSGEQSLADVAAAQEILNGASNITTPELGGDFTVADTAENILAAESLPVDIASIRVTDENLTAAQRDALVELGFDAADLPPLNADDALIEALENLHVAQDAKAEFLDSVEMTEAEVNQALQDAETELQQHILNEGTDAQLNAKVVTAQADLDAAQADLDAAVAADAELAEMLADLEAGQADYQAFVVAANNTVANMTEVVQAYNNDPANGSLIPTVTTAEGVAALVPGATVFTLDGNSVIVLNADGDLVFDATVGATDRAALANVLEAAQSVYDASQAWLAAKDEYAADILAALNFNVDPANHYDIADVTSTYVDWKTGELKAAFYADVGPGVPGALMEAVENAQNLLASAQAMVAERADLINAASDAQALVDQVGALNDAIAEAQAIVDDIGNLIVLSNEVTATDAADIFMYAGFQASDERIIDFSSDDLLFIGQGYSVSTLDADANLNGNADFGNVAVLDIFIQQSGNDAVVYIEGNTYDGQLNGSWAGEKVTLVGVDATSITFENGILRVSEPVIA